MGSCDGEITTTGDGGAFFGMVYSGETRPRPIVHRPAIWISGWLHRIAGWLWDWAERPAEGVPLTPEQLEAHTVVLRDPALEDRLPWPVTIYSDRYGGTYSGGDWLAAIGWAPLFDSPPFDSDVPCFEWWEGQGGARIGRGPTPADALEDLRDRWELAGRPWEYDWNGVQEGEAGLPIDADHAAEVRERAAIAREVVRLYQEDGDPDPAAWLVQGLEPAPDIRFEWAPGHVVISETKAEEEFLAERTAGPDAPARCPAVWASAAGRSRCLLAEGHEGHHETVGGILWQGWTVPERPHGPGEQCPDVAPSLLNGLPTGPRCQLVAGHDGPHRAGESEWREL